MKNSWYDAHGKKILEVTYSEQTKDYGYAYIFSLNPWHTAPISGEITHITVKDPSAIVNLYKREKEVIDILTSEDIFLRMVNSCPSREREYYLNDEEGIEEARTSVFMCHNGAAIITFLWMGFKDVTYESILPYVTRNTYQRVLLDIEPNILIMQETALAQLQYMSGIYLIHFDTTHEFHSFVAWFKYNTVTIYNSYGGYEGFFITTFQTDIWLNMIDDFFKSSYEQQRHKYHVLWGIRENMVQGIFYENYDKSPAGPVEFLNMGVAKIY